MPVKYFAWDDAKNASFRKERSIGFEDIVFHIERGDLLDILDRVCCTSSCQGRLKEIETAYSISVSVPVATSAAAQITSRFIQARRSEDADAGHPLRP